MSEPCGAYRFAVNVTPKPGILDPQGRAVERSLPHLGISGVSTVRWVGGWSSPWRPLPRPRARGWSSAWPRSCCRTP